VRFENKNILATLKNALAYYSAGVAVVNFKAVEWGPDFNFFFNLTETFRIVGLYSLTVKFMENGGWKLRFKVDTLSILSRVA
jgi:hypothetical protein